jgi:hypothetical protein
VDEAEPVVVFVPVVVDVARVVAAVVDEEDAAEEQVPVHGRHCEYPLVPWSVLEGG